MTKQISDERLALIEKCLDEGWSFSEITRTHRVGPKTLRRHFPGRGWTKRQGAQLGYKVMRYVTYKA